MSSFSGLPSLWDLTQQQGAPDPGMSLDVGITKQPGIFDSGGFLDKMANVSNPLMKDSGLPVWAKLLMGTKIGIASGNKAFGLNMTGAGDQMAQSRMMDAISQMLKEKPAGASAPTVLKNDTTQTTPVSRVAPRRVATPTTADLLDDLLTRPRI